MIKITEEMLGDIATRRDAERMVALLRELGYDAEYGVGPGERAESVPAIVWDNCLDIIGRENAARLLGRRGGSMTSERKAAASRENGRKGGRMPRHPEASVVEDNAGGLYLFVFGAGGINGGRVIWAHAGYEYVPGQLSQDVAALIEGCDPREWENCMDNMQTVYDNMMDSDAYEVVAQVHGRKMHLFPRRMGRNAMIEFGVDE